MGVLEEYHDALGDLIFRFEGTLERFAGDGLMVFFNDPVRCDDGPLRAIRMSCRDADPGPRPGGVLGARRATTSRWGSASPRATRPWARIGFDGPLRLRGDRQRDQPGRPAVRRGASRGRSSPPSGSSPPPARSSSARTPATRELRGFSRTCTRTTSEGSTTRGRVMTGDLWTPPARRPTRCPR